MPKWIPDMVPGVREIEPGTVADIIIWMDQMGIDQIDRPELYARSGLSPQQVEEAEEIVIERYKLVSKSHGIQQKHGKAW